MAEAGERSHGQRVDTIEGARNQLAEMITKAENAELDPWTVRYQPGYEKIQRHLHLAAIDFAREMRPLRDRSNGKWSEPLPVGSKTDPFRVEVPDPEESSIDTGSGSVTDEARLSAVSRASQQQQRKRKAIQGDSDRPQFPTTEELIRLGDLEGWRNRYVYFSDYEFDPEQGYQRTERKVRILLPLDVCEAIWDALTDILDNNPNLGIERGVKQVRSDPF